MLTNDQSDECFLPAKNSHLKSVIIGDNGPHSTNYLLFLFRRSQLFKNWDVTAWVKHTDPYGEGILRLFFVTNFYYASNKFVLMFKNIDNTADKDLQETFFLFLSVWFFYCIKFYDLQNIFIRHIMLKLFFYLSYVKQDDGRIQLLGVNKKEEKYIFKIV